jgi:hypothetical protein
LVRVLNVLTLALLEFLGELSQQREQPSGPMWFQLLQSRPEIGVKRRRKPRRRDRPPRNKSDEREAFDAEGCREIQRAYVKFCSPTMNHLTHPIPPVSEIVLGICGGVVVSHHTYHTTLDVSGTRVGAVESLVHRSLVLLTIEVVANQ